MTSQTGTQEITVKYCQISQQVKAVRQWNLLGQ